MTIKVYSTPTCPYCHRVKDYLKSKSVDFSDFDVSSDAFARQEMIRLSGQMGVPVIIIDNEVVVGFDKEKIDKILANP